MSVFSKPSLLAVEAQLSIEIPHVIKLQLQTQCQPACAAQCAMSVVPDRDPPCTG